MQTTPSQMAKEALEVDCTEFTSSIEEVTRMLAKEDGQIGNLKITGRLVEIQPAGEAIIVSDLHGDLESTIHILKRTNFVQKAHRDSKTIMILLGDYGDRGIHSAEVYHIILQLKLSFPNQVVLMRGNHEGPEDLLASPNDLPLQFHSRFGVAGENVYSQIRKLFKHLYTAALIVDRCLLIHGGLPFQTKTMHDLAYAHNEHPKKRLLEDMLWSDPTEKIERVCESPRGAGKLFGENITQRILKKLNAKILIRGHEPCPYGFRINHHSKVLTLFSRKGIPYSNIYGAYLKFDLSTVFENAQHLIPFIHQF